MQAPSSVTGALRKRHTSRITARAGKRMLAAFAAFAVLLAILVALLTSLLDPLQFYHKATWYSPVFSTEQRYQNPGLARNYDYDTIIIGTSMTENFVPTEVDQALGGKTLKLSIRGSTADEHFKIAKLALETGKVKKVLWGLDYFSLKTGDQEAAGPFPDYLYDHKLWNDYKYWFNYSVYEQFFKGIVRELKGTAPQNINYLYNWSHQVTFGKKYVINAYKKAKVEEAYFGLNEEPLDVIKQNFDDHILSLVRGYPKVEFIFYYPPYSILRQSVWKDTNALRYDNQLEMKTWMFQQFDQQPNTRVYDFQAESEWTYNLDLYKDLSHHNQNVNTWIAEAIGKDDSNYRMTAQNAESFVQKLKQQVDSVVVDTDGNLKNAEVSLQGKPLSFSSKSLISDKELLVPAKEAAAALGAAMTWDQASKTLVMERAGHTVTITVGRKQAKANGETVEMPFAAELTAGKTMLPISQAAAMLGYDVALKHEDGQSVHFTISLK
ncbi:copper amine oxidase N-terminal domain-containing protein [Paenibacillus solisilvae]|uniref:Copper amine oxidase N-terminal domain-containing protein n=1 Tax=Paenibacillus solisilvae TaxID=2486751 RepID=A0ABW0W1M7_9BACL